MITGRLTIAGKDGLTENLTDSERDDFFAPNSPNGGSAPNEDAETPQYSYGALFDAPDFATLIKGRRKTGAREYEIKVKSALKAGAIGCMRNGNIVDAATIFRFGPGFAAASGDLAAVNDRAKRAIDLLTAPENPYFAFAMVAIPMLAQFARNHEKQLEQIPTARRQAKQRRKMMKQAEDNRKIATLHIPFMRREIKVRVGLRANPFKGLRQGFRASSQPPEQLVTLVFSDKSLQDALAKMGIEIVQVPNV